MADMKKYLDTVALGALVDQIKAEDKKVLDGAKAYADGLATNYDAAGSAATVQGNLDAYVTSNDAAVALKADKTALEAEVTRAKAAEEANAAAAKKAQDEVDALELVVDTKAAQADLEALAGKVGEVPADQTVMGIINNIQENAYDDTEIRGLITGLDTNKADKTQVALDIAAAVKVEEEARIAAVNGVQGAVDTLSQTHATDKTALEGAIALKADITSLNEVSAVANAAVKQSDYDVKVKALEDEDARIVGLVEAEAAKAREEEGKLDARLVEVETFFKTAEDETLDTALDTLVELQKYLSDEGAVADQMLLDIAANKKAIEDHAALDHDFATADATLKSDLEGQIALKADASVVSAMDTAYKAADTEIKGRLDVLEAIDHDAYVAADTALENKLNAEIVKKADITALNTAVEALEGADASQVERIAALEAKFNGEDSVEDMIAEAKQEAIDAAALDATTKADAAKDAAIAHANSLDEVMDARVDVLEAASATHALKTDVEAIVGRVTTLEGEMDAVEALAAANKSAHEANAAAIALKASQDDLDAAVERIAANETAIAANETAIAANTSAINSFVAITKEEVDALFA